MFETFMKLSDAFLKLSETILKQFRNCLKLYGTCLKLSESVLKLQETCWNYFRRVWIFLRLFWSISETLWVDVETFQNVFWSCYETFLNLFSGSLFRMNATAWSAFGTCYTHGVKTDVLAPAVRPTGVSLLYGVCFGIRIDSWQIDYDLLRVRLGGIALNAGYLELFEFARAMSSVLRLVLKSQTLVSSSDSLDLYKI